MRTIGVVTVARSDYGIYRPVLAAIAAHPDLDLKLYVGGMHLRRQFGNTVEEILHDGYPIAAQVDFLLDDDSAAGVAASIGRGVIGFAEAFSDVRPDILLLLGDRFEMLAAGVATLPFAIPLAHIHGGESSEGLIDEAIRHSLTKLSHLHFASTETYARRIVQLGEEPWRVVVSGAPSLDALEDFVPLTEAELASTGVTLRGPTLLVTWHPVTLTQERTHMELETVLGAVEDSGLDAVMTYPNADTSHSEIAVGLQRLAGSSDRFTVVRSLGSRAYFTLMSRAAAMVGNSSSGIIEAASFALPVVDVGMRQQGRLRAANVIHVGPEPAAVADAIRRAVSPEFRRTLEGLVNPYGDGRAAERIVERLATVPLGESLLVKRFFDLDE
jgi:UDP-hydrolysing UDP-N-acetyl-D-glucosamine 2-epimerase